MNSPLLLEEENSSSSTDSVPGIFYESNHMQDRNVIAECSEATNLDDDCSILS